MRRPLAAFVIAVVGMLAPAGPAIATAGPTTDVVVAWADGSVTTRHVPAASAAADAAALQARPDVRFASLDVPMSAALVPDDARFPDQWGPVQVRAPEAWDRTTGSPDVVVAVVDTGVDATHPDLAGAVLPGIDVVDGDDDPADGAGHGTEVAGVVAARGDNGIGVAGYCWRCSLLPVRVLDSAGEGTSAAVAQGIWWAADHGADVVNLSMAGESYDPGLARAIAYAQSKGAVVVAASGNDGLAVARYPAAFPGVVSVGASDTSDQRASFSDYGDWVDVMAPGVDIATTATRSRYLLNGSGTSFAAPAVSGIVALGRSAFPQLPAGTLVSTLLSSAVTVPAGRRVDAAAYLTALAALPRPVVPTQVAGADRVATAVALSQRAHPSSSPAVVLARADSPADALAAAPLAGRLGAPVLLTGSAALDPRVAAEIRRLGAGSAWLAGGEGALGPGVASALAAAGVTDVHRLAGASRFDTARLVAEQTPAGTVYLADGAGWADAVAVSGLAAFTRRPVLLTSGPSLPVATRNALAAVSPSDVVVLGGPAAVPESVLDEMRASGAVVRRVWGATRYDTSVSIAGEAVAAGAGVAETWLATGADWPDALAAGPAASALGGVLLLMDGRDLARSPSVTTWLGAHRADVRDVVVVGGDRSVTAATVSSLAAALAPA